VQPGAERPHGLRERSRRERSETKESMSARDNSRIAHSIWDATSRGDAAGVRDLLSPHIQWHTFSSGALTGDIKGRDDVVDLLARSGELVEGLYSDLIDVFASETGAVLHYKVRAHRGLQSLDTEILMRMRIEDEQIVDVFTVTTTPEQNDSFWFAQ
jgi:ketosteroid isomerase-like protein